MSPMKNVEFYFFPASFYSQRARLALIEKGVEHKETIVWIASNEQNQPWYLKVNPNGTVPGLRVGDKCYSQSEDIVDAVDKLSSSSQSKLVPGSDTPEGADVSYWRKRLDEIPVGVVTFGTAVFPEFAVGRTTGGLFPDAQGVRNRFEGNIRYAEKMKAKHPHLSEDYDKKIVLANQRLASFFDKEKVTSVLNDLDANMAQVEQQLIKMSKAGGDYFLCGQSYTAADINLCILLERLRLLGLLHRFADPSKYPNLDKYWQRVRTRPAVKKVCINYLSEVKRVAIGRKVRRYGGVAVALGVVGVAVWFAHSHFKK